MVQQVISIGSAANDGTGDPLRTAFTKINQNFTEIYGRDATGANFDFTDNTLSSTNTNGDIDLDPNGTGKVVISDNALVISTTKTPTTSRGAAGDRKGMIAWDSGYIYVCTANSDGSTNVWKRASIGGTW